MVDPKICPISSTILDYRSLDECTLLVFKVNLQTHAFHKSLVVLHLVFGPIDTTYIVFRNVEIFQEKKLEIFLVKEKKRIGWNIWEHIISQNGIIR
jgi:hypothetical protein